jgi:hypothetical protein
MRRKKLNRENNVFTGSELWRLLIREKAYLQTVWTNIYRREFLVEHTIQFVDRLFHEDELFTVEVLSRANRIQCIDQPLYYYRSRQDSIVGQAITEKHIRDIFFILQQFYILKTKNPELQALIDYRRYAVTRSLSARLRDKSSRSLFFSLSAKNPPLKDIKHNNLFTLSEWLEIQVMKYFRRLYIHMYLWLIARYEEQEG